MDYRFKVFLAVVENLSFSKAAKELFISQPAVSKHIRELENSLGIELLERRGNKIYLTKAGGVVCNYSRKAKQLQSELEFSIGKFTNNYNGLIRIGASSTITQYVLPPVLADFHKKYKDIELNLYNGNSVEMEKLLLDNKIDLALVENQTSVSNLKYSAFMQDEIVVVASSVSSISKKEFIELKELYSYPIVFRERGSGTLEVIESFLKKEKIEISRLNVLLHLGSTEAIKNFLPKFEGLALISGKSLAKELQLNMIKIIPIKGKHIKRSFRLVIPKTPVFELTKTFISFLKHYNF
jgi:LysR family transcriptional regulator, transcriptional activator of the cysJI operon